MEKKGIAFIIGSLGAGGAERVISTLSNELIKAYRVTIITFKNVQPFYELDPRIKVIPCVDQINPSSNLLKALRLNYALLSRIKTLLAQNNIQLVIGFLTRPNILAILAAKSLNIPVVISERNNPTTDKAGFIWNALRKFLYPKADYVVVQTEQIRDFYSSWITASKLLILPNPISPSLEIQKSIIPNKKNVILNVGRLTEQKGQDVLIKAFCALNLPDWELVIVGEGTKREAYQKIIDENQMSDNIHLVGKKKNIGEFYRSAKIFAFSSRFEGFPNALIEAMHMGLPCVSTNCPTGPSKLIIDNENGFLIDVDDQNSLENKLKQLTQDPEIRKRFGELSSHAVEHLTIKNVSREWSKVISSALENKS